MKKIFYSLLLTLILVPCITLAQEVFPVEHGDLNCDGSVNVLDAVLEIDRVIHQGWADTDDDGTIDVFEDHCDNHYVEGMASNPLEMEEAYDNGYDVGFTEGELEGYDIGFDDGVESVPEQLNCLQSGFCVAAYEYGYGSGEALNGHATMEECIDADMYEWDYGFQMFSFVPNETGWSMYAQYLCTP